LNYDRQSRGGYFDPNDYYSNRAFVSFYVERPKFHLFPIFLSGNKLSKEPAFPAKILRTAARPAQVTGRFAIYFSSSA
jgi:hypothetical protein